MAIQLVWFRSDLRVRDNPALVNAMAAGPTLALFVVSEAQWREHGHGDNKIHFIYRNVIALQRELAKLKVPLVVMSVPEFADTAEALVDWVTKWQVAAVYANGEYALNERQRDKACKGALAGVGVELHLLHGNRVIAPSQLVKDDGTHYQVYTPFSKRWREIAEHQWQTPLAMPTPQQALAKSQLPNSEFDLPKALAQGGDKLAALWPGGEVEAQNRLLQFCDRAIADYKEQRDFPAIEGTSTLSAYLNVGAISVRQALAEVLRRYGWHTENRGAKTWVNELIWGEFYHAITWHNPRVCRYQPYIAKGARVPWRQDDDAFERWCSGNTGVPIVDAAMRQLLATGWMHNRLRMVVAMYLSKNLLLDWRRGEAWFMEHLVDGDFAANNGGWQWSASTGTDAAPYFRLFNPFSQAARFDPDARFMRRYLPELAELPAKALQDEKALEKSRPAEYPEPLVDLKFSRERALETFKTALQS